MVPLRGTRISWEFPQGSAATTLSSHFLPGLILDKELRPRKLCEAAKKRTKKKAQAFLMKHLNSSDTQSEQEDRVNLLE